LQFENRVAQTNVLFCQTVPNSLPRLKILALYSPSKQNWSAAQNPVPIVIAKTRIAFIVQLAASQRVLTLYITGTLTFSGVDQGGGERRHYFTARRSIISRRHWAAVEYDLSASSLAISSPSGASFMYERSFLKTRSGNGTVKRFTKSHTELIE
jgi:hypothetical protein